MIAFRTQYQAPKTKSYGVQMQSGLISVTLVCPGACIMGISVSIQVFSAEDFIVAYPYYIMVNLVALSALQLIWWALSSLYCSWPNGASQLLIEELVISCHPCPLK